MLVPMVNILLTFRAMEVSKEIMEATRCPILKVGSDATAVWAARKGNLTARYDIQTKSAEDAENITKIIDGFKALVALRVADDAAVEEDVFDA